MEVIEELQGPVIIITPPQEHFRRPHNTDNSVYLHLALWGNGELYKSMQKRVLNIFICSLCTLIFLNTVFYPTLNFVYWLMSRWGLSNLNNCLELIFGLLCPETSNVIVWKINFRTLSNAIADEGSFGDWSLVLKTFLIFFLFFCWAGWESVLHVLSPLVMVRWSLVRVSQRDSGPRGEMV